ncbi:MAG: PepSY domain-containing protein [Solirubrobacteraceae bacterium]
MNRTRTRTITTAAVAAVLAAAGGTGYAVAAGDDGDFAAAGSGADRARAAALALVPGAKANGVERDSENGATWEVEVTRADGATVDVRLDASYDLVVVEDDREEN